MENINQIRLADRSSWSTTLANLLPLWLLSFAIMVEGFPRPPISMELAIASFVIAIAVGIVLLLKRWMTAELALYSLIPFTLLPIFDEISTTYKTPFIVLCALLLTAGAVGYQRSRPAGLRWLILLFAAIVTLAAAIHAGNNFWGMVGDLGYGECFPDFTGCAPLTGQEPTWLTLFFSF